ncbi:hypothetical protein T01_9270, partial [Trichinella spiralis]
LLQIHSAVDIALFAVSICATFVCNGSETTSDIIIRNLPAEIVMDTAFWTGRQ